MLAPARDCGFGITRLDTLQGRPGMAACYAVVREGEVAFIEAGTSPGVPALLEWLDAAGLEREQVRYVIPTHVHLDHAGGAGLLMAACPQAQLLIHPRGARHMIDPAALIAGATAVYGPEMVAREYGEIRPIAANRVVEAADGTRWSLGDSHLAIIDSPGHAKHHFCIHDPVSQGLFTGDTFGLSYREFDTDHGPFLIPTTTPIQFDPDAWDATLDRLMALRPQRAYLTHFDVVEQLEPLAEVLRAGLRDYVRLAQSAPAGEGRHRFLRDGIADLTRRQLTEHGCTLTQDKIEELLGMDFDLNAQGLGVWLDRA